mmetsp:Transcript_15198/g.28413  ORF Transcript_15198/g.28413 Transcript_15198/m.28413 type:complete len:165 (-) Transcript_15198:138-632(-)
MSVPPDRADSGVSLAESEQEALSQECLVETGSLDSLSSGEDTGNAPGVSSDSAPVTIVETIPETLKAFVEVAKEEPLFTTMKEFRAKWKKHHEIHLATPSAFIASDNGEKMRLEFSAVVQEVGSPQQQTQWTALSPEQCDKFLCHIFLPPELGGILPAYEEEQS